GWQYLQGILKDTKKDFLFRYAGLRATRFFWDYRSDILAKADLQAGVELLLDQGDIADLAIEDLRKWKAWSSLDRILGLAGKPTHDAPIIQRAILRFALSCQERPKAAEYVRLMRQKDAEKVKDVEDLLKLETTVKPSPTTQAKTK